MKIKGLGRHIETKTHIGTDLETEYDFRCIDKIVLSTTAIPFCVKQASGSGGGLIYYDNFGHCIKAARGIFYFEAKILPRCYQRITAFLEKGEKDKAFEFLQKHTRSYLEIS